MKSRPFILILSLGVLLAGCRKSPEAASPSPSRQAAPAAPAARKILFYRNPMDPSVTSPVPAKDGMGMDYIPVYSEGAEDGGSAQPGIAGLATVQAGPEAFRLAGVQTAVAERQTLHRATRAAGLVVPDETRVRRVQTRMTGWVEKLYVNATGQLVRAGQPLLSLYSPELLATQEELLRAREAAARFAGSALPEVRRGGEDLVTAARRRLELLDVPASVIARLERTGTVQRAITLTAPAGGYVTAKSVFEGQQVQPGMDLLTLADLSRVWVEADVYPFEASSVRLGQKAVVRLPYGAGAELTGRIAYVYPTLDAQSRTLKVRIELANPGLVLKPGMFVDVAPDQESAEGIVVPDSAVIDTGARQVVFVAKGGGFEPRDVRVGSRGDGKAVILSGVAAGERVAVRANFLLDSESRLRAALQAPAPAPAPTPGGAR